MNEKLANAISWGPEELLKRFVNLPDKPGESAPAEEFRNLFGDLWLSDYPPEDYWDMVRAFRIHWAAKTRPEKQQLISFIGKLFANQLRPAKLGDAKISSHPLLRVDSVAGTVELPIETLIRMLTSRGAIRFEPPTLLHYLAMWLLTFRRQGRLAICELKDCHRFYVKEHPRYRYCSPECGYEASTARKIRWWRKNRGAGAAKRGKKR